MQRMTIGAAAALVVVVMILLAFSVADRSADSVDVVSTTGATSTPTETALPLMTPLPTPLGPTPTDNPEWEVHGIPALGPETQVGEIAFAPDSFDVAFTVSAGYKHGDALFLAEADVATGDLTGEVSVASGLPADEVQVLGDPCTTEGLGGYTVGTRGLDDEGPYNYHDVWFFSDDGSTATNLTQGAMRVASHWCSPDGDWLAILDDDAQILLHDTQSLTTTVLTTGVAGPSGAPGANVAWSPSSDLIAMGYAPSVDESLLVLLDVDSQTSHVLNSQVSAIAPVPVFIADGSEILYFAETPSGTGGAGLYSIDALPGAQPSLVATIPGGPVVTGLLHPNGQNLIFGQANSSGGIYSIGVAGGTATLLSGVDDVAPTELAVTSVGNASRAAYVYVQSVQAATEYDVGITTLIRSIELSP